MKLSTNMVIVSLLIVLVIGKTALGQQCGPGCPACSGKTIGDLQSQATVLGSGLFIPDGEEETSVYQIRYGLFSWADLGIGYAHMAEVVIWSLRLQPIIQDQDGWLDFP